MSSAVAYAASSDFATLKEKAGEVVRDRSRPTRFEMVSRGINLLCDVALEWDKLPNELRDVFRHLASSLTESSKHSWLQRQKAGMQMWLMIARHGVDQVSRQAKEVVEASERFVSIVLANEERANPVLQAKLADAISLALNPATPRTRLARGQVGDWVKRIPS